jgi:sortase A
MAIPRLQTAVAGVLAHPPRLRASRSASGFGGGLMLLIGVVLLIDALVTVVWQDPFTAVFAQHDQKVLSQQLAATERAPLPPSTLALVQRAETSPERMALLAKHLGARTKAGEPLGRIGISRIGASFVFVAGTGKQSLKKGPGHYGGGALPGQRGTVGIAGHRTTYAAPFRRLDRMRPGDRVTLTMPYGRYSYAVEGKRIVSPGHTSVLRAVKHDRLVLTTCHPLDSSKRRLVVTARVKSATPRGAAIQYTPTPPVAPKL